MTADTSARRIPSRVPRALLLSVGALLAALAPHATAQEQLDIYAGLAAGDGLTTLAEVGDLDGDGITEHVAGAPLALDGTGRAVLFHGGDGVVITSWVGEQVGDRLGHAVAGVGDVNGDDVPDIAVGAPGGPGSSTPGTVYVFSGADHSTLLSIQGPEAGSGFGFSLSLCADADADQVGDLLIGAPFSGNDRGRAQLHSGADGALLAWRDGGSDGDTYAYSLDGSLAVGHGTPEPVIGEMLSGGNPEPVIGAPQLGNGGAGYVEFLDLASFLPEAVRSGDGPHQRYGLAVAWAGDVDADGLVDCLITSSPVDASAQPVGPGRVELFGGAFGSLRHVFEGEVIGDGFGLAIAGIGDVDGDGHDDVAVGAPWSDGPFGAGSQAGMVHIIDGATGNLAHRLHGPPGGRFGTSLAFAGDIDQDGKADTAIGTPGADTNGPDAGAVLLFAFDRWVELSGDLAGAQGTGAPQGDGELGGG